ncbi:Uncharacterised protein [Leminorella richardii]|uniref:Uncharacterized protein n=1 Tax=Leminorella richardii TaxID=158841 RepID=A0A2X4UCI6_9GAMM|nr:SMI1/KNR4 family protein [Leminorella richardii]SQI36329.1 Uncharacterised protein [Leminorella richardii]
MSCRYEKEASLLIEALNAQGVSFAIGLSDAEAGEVECVFGFQFPPDLKALLQQALPISSGFVDWRAAMGSKKARRQIAERMAAPLEGILFDIKHNDYWLDSWGSRPAVFSERKARVERLVADAPRLIPLYSHRYLPDTPCEAGNPVFSVYQTDIIYYGNDLASYFAAEFGFTLPGAFHPANEPKPVAFWCELVL